MDSPSDIVPQRASLFVGLVGQTALYALNVLCSTTVIILLARKRRWTNTYISLAILLTVMFALCTTHFVLTSIWIMAELFPKTFRMADVPHWLHIGLHYINCLLGDLVVIWRVWVLWKPSARHIYPLAFCWFASIVAFTVSTVLFARPPAQNRASLDVSTWALIASATTLLTNIYALVLIARRYWIYRRDILSVLGGRIGPDNTRVVFHVMIESGSLYCIAWIIEACVYASGSNSGIFITWACLPQLTSLTPTAIILLVFWNVDKGNEQLPDMVNSKSDQLCPSTRLDETTT